MLHSTWLSATSQLVFIVAASDPSADVGASTTTTGSGAAAAVGGEAANSGGCGDRIASFVAQLASAGLQQVSPGQGGGVLLYVPHIHASDS